MRHILRAMLAVRPSRTPLDDSRRRVSRHRLIQRLETRDLMAVVPDPSFGVGGVVTTNFPTVSDQEETVRSIAIDSDGKILFAGSGSRLVRYEGSGAIDTGFGENGMARQPGLATKVLTQADGKIVVAGRLERGGSSDFYVARYEPSGEFDATFDFDGKLVTDFFGGFDYANDAAVQSDGKIVLVGASAGDNHAGVAMVRYNSDGSLDGSFGTAGRLLINNIASAEAVTVRPDGTIIIAGSRNNGTDFDFIIMRFFSDGTVDTSFGIDGTVITDFGGTRDTATDFVELSDQSLLVAGTVQTGVNRDFAVAKYHANGTLDTSFGSGGVVTTDVGSDHDFLREIAIQADGRVVATGQKRDAGVLTSAVTVRYNVNGSLDSSFDGDGIVITSLNQFGIDQSFDVVVRDDGKILTGGSSTVINVNRDAALYQYNTNGSLDTSFGSGGVVKLDFGDASEYLRSLAVSQSGHIVGAGRTQSGFAVAKYLPDGTPDSSFGGDGKVVTPFDNGGFAESVVIQNDSKIIVGGYRADSSNRRDFALTRYESNGDLDASFGIAGKVITDIAGSYDEAYEALVLPDGSILAAGGAITATSWDFALVKYLSTGVLDTSFGVNGTVTTDFGTSAEIGYAMAVQSDGKIVVAGYHHNGSDADVAVTRYFADGSLDLAFGSEGKVIIDFDRRDERARSIAIQQDGKIVLGGSSGVGFNQEDFIVVRLNADGSLDTTFDSDGKLQVDIGGTRDIAYDLGVQSDGKIVLAGQTDAQPYVEIGMIRVLPDGGLDPEFGDGGVLRTGDLASSTIAYAIAIQDDDRILAGGTVQAWSRNDFAVIRYLDADPVEVESVMINDGAATRSRVDSLTITFTETVDETRLQTALEVTNLGTGINVGEILVDVAIDQGKTIASLTFDGASTDQAYSLVNGNYRLTINANKVLSRNGIAMGGDYVFTGANAERDDFFRFLGDSDGDRDVDGQDYGRFGLSFLKTIADPEFNAGFDFDRDGDVDGQDYGRFGQQFLQRLPKP